SRLTHFISRTRGSSVRPAVAILVGLHLLCSGSSAWAQPATPKPPDKYKVLLRYRIIAPRDPHVAAYDALVKHLESLDFKFLPPYDDRPKTDREDSSKDRFEGLVPSAKTLDILRNTSVQSLVLIPEKFEMPEDPDRPVRVQIELGGSMDGDRAQEFAE